MALQELYDLHVANKLTGVRRAFNENTLKSVWGQNMINKSEYICS